MPTLSSISAMVLRPAAILVLCMALADAADAPSAKPLQVGSKRFTESYILGEIVRQTLVAHGVPATHKAGLGNTGILVAALEAGEIDAYPEYTGTIVREILKRDGSVSLDELDRLLAPRGLKVSIPLGFSNSYAFAMREEDAEKRGITRISDLVDPARTKDLKLGLSNEFLARADGWPALKAAYALRLATPSGLDHGLAYDALAGRKVDLIDIYSTDARIERDRLRVLDDDRRFFPSYEAVLLTRREVDTAPLEGLRNAIDTKRMIALNGRAELDRIPFADVAQAFVASRDPAGAQRGKLDASQGKTARFVALLFGPDFVRLLVEHVLLVGVSVAGACVVAIPLGVWASRDARASRLILGTVSILQTIPSLALLALLITAVGTIGTVPALIALFLYALLPIVANTTTGLEGVSRGIRQAADALGLRRGQRLALIELPLAAPTIVAGVRTAAVINVGTATVAAFVGAGGFGERITAGLALNDGATMLAGAVPAAGLAIVVQSLLDVAAHAVDPVRRHARETS